MGELRAALEEAGFSQVRALLQSGNVVLAHDGDSPDVKAAVRRILTPDGVAYGPRAGLSRGHAHGRFRPPSAGAGDDVPQLEKP